MIRSWPDEFGSRHGPEPGEALRIKRPEKRQDVGSYDSYTPSASANAASSLAPSPRNELPCMVASVRGRVAASLSTIARAPASTAMLAGMARHSASDGAKMSDSVSGAGVSPPWVNRSPHISVAVVVSNR